MSGRKRSGSVAGAAFVAAVSGAAVFGIASAVVVVLRPRGVLLGAGMSVAVAVGYAMIALWLCLALRRLGVIRDNDREDGDGWGGCSRDPSPPQLPPDGPDLWPEFERELRAYLEAHERQPVT